MSSWAQLFLKGLKILKLKRLRRGQLGWGMMKHITQRNGTVKI